MKGEKYFNFPIILLQGVCKGDDSKRNDFLKNLLYYHIAKHSEKLPFISNEESEEQRFQRSASFWNVDLKGNLSEKVKQGFNLLESFKDSKVFIGIKTEIFWEFYKNHKTDFEWHLLITYLSLKSILGQKKYCKSNNALLYSRMEGNESKQGLNDLGFTEYYRTKLINKLESDWNLKYYSRYTRGFYFGFDIDLEKLIFSAENLKEENKKKLLQDEKKKILEKWKNQNGK